MTGTPTIESIQAAALQLQPAARAELTHLLVQSLTALPASETSALWVAEAQRRDVEMDDGRVVGIPSEEVFRRLQNRYGM